jgi:hypothetical protein
MAPSNLGYPKDLFILPYDHRGSFEAGLLGPDFSRAGREVTPKNWSSWPDTNESSTRDFLKLSKRACPLSPPLF